MFIFKPWLRFTPSSTSCAWASPSITYSFSLSPDGTMLDVCCASPSNDAERKMVGWIRDVLAPRIVKWMQADVSVDGSLATSLKLVNVPRYYDVYDGLKRKYAGPLKKVSF
jgi:hypothetical protein